MRCAVWGIGSYLVYYEMRCLEYRFVSSLLSECCLGYRFVSSLLQDVLFYVHVCV
jgi:hypothetical protein